MSTIAGTSSTARSATATGIHLSSFRGAAVGVTIETLDVPQLVEYANVASIRPVEPDTSGTNPVQLVVVPSGVYVIESTGNPKRLIPESQLPRSKLYAAIDKSSF